MKKTSTSSTQFTIDLDFRGIFFFVVLAILTAMVLFYLGVLFGKASRNPNLAPYTASEKVIPEKPTQDKITPNNLEIYNIRNDNEQVTTLKDSTKSALEEADRVLNDSNQYQNESDTPPVSKQAEQPPAEETAEPAQWPDKSPTTEMSQDTYTVQVFATKDRDKADRIVRLLRQQQFDAYLAQANIENQTIYRVRVGRKSKSNIEQLNEELKKVIGGMGMKSRIIKIN